MAADMKEMHHMLRLAGRDKPEFRFLWRDCLKEKPSVYEFEREQCLEKCLRHPERTTL